MATFDQRNQTVTYQYNAAGDINVGQVRDRMELLRQLDLFREELVRARESGVVDKARTIEADDAIGKAVLEVRKSEPDKNAITGFLEKAAKIISGAAALGSLVSAIGKAVEVVGKVL